jgi:hypothetical protein
MSAIRKTKDVHELRMLQRKASQQDRRVQFERFYPSAALAKRKDDLNRKFRRMYASPSFQKLVKAEQAKKDKGEQNAENARG